MKVTNQLVALRERANLTQVDVAKAMNVSQSTISTWETGTFKPRSDRLLQLAKLYGCTVDALLASGTEEGEEET